MSSIIDSSSIYPGTLLTAGQVAQVGDVLIVAAGSNTLNHATCTVTGATVIMLEQKNQQGTGSLQNSATILTGLVTASGTPAYTLSGDSDMGFRQWIVRGLSSASAHASGGNFGIGNPLTGTGNTTVPCSLFLIYLNESANNFTSWNGSISADAADPTHADAYGIQLDMDAGNYTPGFNCTSEQNNTLAFIFLPISGVVGVAPPNMPPPSRRMISWTRA